MGKPGCYSMLEVTLMIGNLGKFTYQVIQQITAEHAYYTWFWENQGKFSNIDLL